MPSTRIGRRLRITATATLALGTLCLGATAFAAVPVQGDSVSDAQISLEVLGSYETGVFDESAAEIVAFHPGTQRTFVVNAQSGAIDVLNAADPTTPSHIGTIEAANAEAIPDGAVANSVSIRNDGLVVAAIEAPVKTDPGWLLFADAATLNILGTVQVGSLPDMVTVTPDGTRAVVANEGEPADDYSSDPEGSVAVVDLPETVAAATQSQVRLATFHDFEAGGSKTLPDEVRIYGPTPESDLPVSRNLEPEYIAVDASGTTAYAALQENNAVAVIDLTTATVTDIWSLGAKDHSIDGQGIDASDRDEAINIATWPIKGLYMPDGINAYTASGQTYLVTANEGDAREWGDYAEPARIKDLGDDGLAPICADSPAAELTGNAELGRLNISTASGLDEDHADGPCYSELYSFGGRSFSIWSTDGTLVFDSGDEFEQTIARVIPDYFNSNHSESGFDGRSDDKGPEPENLTIGTIGERTYAFIGFERVGGVIVYDITDPANASYVSYINRRDFSVSAEDALEDAADPAAVLSTAGDLGPEGLTFVKAADSPTGEAMVIVGSEVSGTTTFFSVKDLAEPTTGPLAIDPTDYTIAVGGTLTGTITGAVPGEQLTLTLFSDPVELGTVTAAADGTAPFALTVPASIPAGSHTLQAAGTASETTATASVTITADASSGGSNGSDGAGSSTGAGSGKGSSARGNLPETGSGSSLWMLVVAGAGIATGATALVRARR